MATPSRVLVLSAAVGAGHTRAAQAVELALRELSPAAHVRHVDILTLTNAAFRRVYAKSYLDLVNVAPHVLGLMYDLLDKPGRFHARGDRLRLLVERVNLSGFRDLLEAERPDVVVNTHFLPAEIIASLRKRGKTTVPQMTVTTDFETHRLWVNPPTDAYTTATAEGAAYLQHWGVPAGSISVTGIPIHPAFSKPIDRAAALAKHGLSDDGRPIVLQLAGGFGVGPIAKLFAQVLGLEQPVQVVAVTGRNAAAKAELSAMVVPPRHRATVLGYTDQMHELMAVADLVMSKPGGLTTSEALASGAAMLIVNPIPGQEARNSDYLLEQGAAVKVNNLATLAVKLATVLGDRERLASLKANARRIARPRATYDVATAALTLADVGVSNGRR
jgi:processive 1,2-diacylglycerol beta-glucosyltransferase